MAVVDVEKWQGQVLKVVVDVVVEVIEVVEDVVVVHQEIESCRQHQHLPTAASPL